MIVTINSQDRSSSTANDFTIPVIMPPTVKKVRLLEVSVWMTMFVINSSNNILSWRENSGSILSATIPIGNYTPSTLTTQLKSLMDPLATNTYTITYNPTTSFLTISGDTNPFTLLFSSSNSPWKYLGFSNIDTTSNLSHTGLYSLNLSPAGLYYLNIDGPGIAPTRASSTFANFPINLNANFGERVLWHNSSYPDLDCSVSSGRLTVSLLDSKGSPVTLNSDWCFVLYFY